MPTNEDVATTCRLCGAPLPGDGDGGGRCPNCGLHPVSGLDRRAYGRLAAGLAGIYLLTALLVLLTRSR
jgi:hypothetical protein